jgi:origin recognition complex subunit 2
VRITVLITIILNVFVKEFLLHIIGIVSETQSVLATACERQVCNAQPPYILMSSTRGTPRRPTGDAVPTIIHVSGHTRPKRTPRQTTRTPSKRVAKETKTPTGRRGKRASKPESDEGPYTRVGTPWLDEDEEMDDAERSSTESQHSEEDSEEEADELPSPTKTPVARKATAESTKRMVSTMADGEPPTLESFVNQTAFDVYFSHANRKLHISKHVLSALMEPLSKDEYKTLIARSDSKNPHVREIERLNTEHTKWFGQYALELEQGFNLCFYGYGSKRGVINAFARSKCAKRGHVVVVNGYIPSLRVKDILGAIEQVPGMADVPVAAGGSGIEGQTRRICEFFHCDTRTAPLYLVVHNIDGPGLRDGRARGVLATLALHPRIHLVASVDHVHAPLLWSAAEVAARKHTGPAAGGERERGYAWVFHDLTTFVCYDEEISAARDVTALPGPAQAAGAGGFGGAGPLAEVAVAHVLASVTEKARKLFRLLATRQLAAIAGSGRSGGGGGGGGGETHDDNNGEKAGVGEPMGVVGMDKYGMQYDLLFQAARQEFIATSDTALRALLGEFMDHGVVASVQMVGQPEVLWIPAPKEMLRRILKAMADA